MRYGILPSSRGEQDILFESNALYEAKSEKGKHLEYLKTKFQVNCSKEIFSNKDFELLKNYGAWMEALCLRKINPLTKEQVRFIEQIDQEKMPDNEYAKIWYKYINRLEIERKYGDRLKIKYVADANDFYRREDYYKLHKEKIRRI